MTLVMSKMWTLQINSFATKINAVLCSKFAIYKILFLKIHFMSSQCVLFTQYILYFHNLETYVYLIIMNIGLLLNYFFNFFFSCIAIYIIGGWIYVLVFLVDTKPKCNLLRTFIYGCNQFIILSVICSHFVVSYLFLVTNFNCMIFVISEKIFQYFHFTNSLMGI